MTSLRIMVMGLLALLLVGIGQQQAFAQRMYWVGTGATVQRANLDGSNVEDLVTGFPDLAGANIALDVAGGKMYWTQATHGNARRANLEIQPGETASTRTDIEDLVIGASSVGVALDVGSGKIYWTQTSTGKVQRANFEIPAGETASTRTDIEDLVVGGSNNRHGIVLDLASGKMYFVDAVGGRIQRANIEIPAGETASTRTDIEDLVTGLGGFDPSSLALDVANGTIYFTRGAFGGETKIQRVNIEIPSGETPSTRSDIETLFTLTVRPFGLTLDLESGQLYWGTFGTVGSPSGSNKIQRANIEIPAGETASTRTDIEDLVTGLDGVFGIALERPSVCVVPPSDLVGWWDGEGDAEDIVGVNDGTLVNGATTVLGKVGSSFSFDGVDDRVDIADSPSLRPQQFTLEAWVKLNSNELGAIASKQFGSNFLNSYQIFVLNGELGGIISNGSSNIGLGDGASPSSGIVVPVGQQFHTAMTWDGNELRLYFNGVLGASRVIGPVAIAYDDNEVNLGADHQTPPGGLYSVYLDGLIDEAGIYNRALTEQEIEDIFLADGTGKCTGNQTLLGTIEKGRVREDGNIGGGGPSNYAAGVSAGFVHRSFFVFSIPSLDGQDITDAKIRIFNPLFSSPDPTETYTLFDVDPNSISELLSNADPVGLSVFDDVGSGQVIGQKIVSSADNGQIVEIPLNAAGLVALNDSKGLEFAVGGSLTSLSGQTSTGEIVFSATGSESSVSLLLFSQGESQFEVCDGVDNDLDGTIDEDFPDIDIDGIADCVDEDDDNDGVPDTEDNSPLDPIFCADVDGDTCDDCSIGRDQFGVLPDNDPSNDGPDFDADGLCNAGDNDDDGDGLLDLEEIAIGTDPLNPDTDGDGFTDAEEVTNGTDPLNNDTTLPDTTITASPPAVTNNNNPSFSFVSTEAGSTFECSLDGGEYTACHNPKSYGGLSDGSHTFDVRAIDPAGNVDPTQANFSWTIDTAPPVIIQADDLTVEATSPSGVVVNFPLPIITDLIDPLPTIVAEPPSGSTFALGRTTVVVTATDSAGNQSKITFSVTVIDSTPPVLTALLDLIVEAEGPSGASVLFQPTASDVVDPLPTVIASPPSGSTFALGVTTVTVTATDASGNQSQVTFTVTVVDTTSPVVTSPADITVEAAGSLTAVAIGTATATDVVGAVSLTNDAPANGFPVGLTTVTWTATDAAGNVGNASQAIGVFNADIADGAEVGSGVVIGDGATIGSGARIGDNAVIEDGAVLAKDSSLGSSSVIGSGSTLNKDVSVGDNTNLGSGVILNQGVSAGDNLTIGDGSTAEKNTSIGDNVSLGSNVTIKKDVVIGSGVAIGNNTIVGQETMIGVSAQIGANVTIGKNVNVAPGAVIPDGSVIPANTNVT